MTAEEATAEVVPLIRPIHRIEFRDNLWADIKTDGITNRERRAIVEARERVMLGKGTLVSWADAVGRTLVRAWNFPGGPVRDEDGELNVDAWDDAPGDLSNAICEYAQRAWGDWAEAARPFPQNGSTSSST